jgi:hypothetical protein
MVDPIQMVGRCAELRGLRGCGCLSGQMGGAAARGRAGLAFDPPVYVSHRWRHWAAPATRGFRLVRTMYPPTSGHESTASRHAP